MDTLLYIFALYLPFQIALNPASGIDLASIRVLAIGIFIFWLIRSFKKIKIIFSSSQLPWLIVLFCLISAFSLLFAQNIGWGVRKLAFLLSFFPLFFVFSDTSKNERAQFIKYLVWSATLLAGLGIIQFLTQFLFGLDKAYSFWVNEVLPVFLGQTFSQAVAAYPSFMVNISGDTVLRAFSVFPDPHMFSLFLGMIFPLALFMGAKNKNYYLPAFIILTAILLSFSRGSYVAVLSGSLILLLLTINKHNFFKERLAILATTIFVIASFISIPSTAERFSSTFNVNEGSNQGRVATWKDSLSVGLSHWPFGVGLGNYPLEVKPTADYREPIYSHNLYLDLWSETGIFSASLFITILLTAWIKFYKRSFKNSYALAPAMSLSIFAIHSLFETALFSVHILPLLIILIALSNDQDSNQL